MAEAETTEEWWQRDPLGFCIAKIKDPDDQIRLDSAMHLGLIGPDEPEGLKALAGALHDSDHWVRVEAAWSLWKCSRGIDVVETELVRALSNSDDEVRWVSALTLSANVDSGQRSLGAILAALNAETDPVARVRLADAVLRIDGANHAAADHLRAAVSSNTAKANGAVAEILETSEHLPRTLVVELQELLENNYEPK